MYKVFMNEKPIFLTDSTQEYKNFEVVKYEEINFLELLELVNSSLKQGVLLICKDLKKSWKDFKKNFKVVKAAGGKVFNEDKEVLFIYRLGKWDLPKGHIEKGEKKRVAAIREVEEECGVEGLEILKKLPTTYHSFYYGEQLCLKVTYWYSMKTSFKGELIPQLEEDITEVVYKNEEQISVALENTYENIKLLF